MRIKFLLAVLVATSMGLFANGNGEDGTLKLYLGGSTTIEPVMTGAIEAFTENVDPTSNLSYHPVGSTAGIRGVLNGVYDLGTASRDLYINEKEQGAEVINFALDGIAIITSGDVGVTNITLEQLAGIYVGEIKNWNQIGGPDAEIVVVNRDQASGTYGAFEELVLEMVYGDDGKFIRDAIVTSSNGNMAATITNTPYSIGYGSLAIIDTHIAAGGKVLSVNGVEDTPENITTGRYPIVRPLSFVTYGQPGEEAQMVVDFLLGESGKEIILDAGFVPLN